MPRTITVELDDVTAGLLARALQRWSRLGRSEDDLIRGAIYSCGMQAVLADKEDEHHASRVARGEIPPDREETPEERELLDRAFGFTRQAER